MMVLYFGVSFKKIDDWFYFYDIFFKLLLKQSKILKNNKKLWNRLNNYIIFLELFFTLVNSNILILEYLINYLIYIILYIFL